MAGVLAGQPDPRELVRQSIRNGERSWARSFEYYCLKNDVDRELGSDGHVKSIDGDLSQIIPTGYNTSFDFPLKHDNEPVAADVRAKAERDLARLRAESPAQKRRQFQKLEAQRSYMKEVPDAFNFRIVGTDNLPTGPAWVLEATPRPGYQPQSRYAHMFPYMRGKLWIDKRDVQWVKADAVATDTVSFGFFIARLAKGSHIILQQTRLPDGDWVPGRIQARASARMFIFFLHNFEEDITYRDYHKPGAAVAASRTPLPPHVSRAARAGR